MVVSGRSDLRGKTSTPKYVILEGRLVGWDESPRKRPTLCMV
jgi:hypothetical protein